MAQLATLLDAMYRLDAKLDVVIANVSSIDVRLARVETLQEERADVAHDAPARWAAVTAIVAALGSLWAWLHHS